jgi:predicted N-formylglutamate amidohydrolase
MTKHLHEPDLLPLDTADLQRPDGESKAFELLSGSLEKGLVLVCDHASNALPVEYGSLGLPTSEFERHIAYDIGSAEVTRLMSKSLGVPAVLSTFSRLLVDPNRAPDDPTLIMQLSDGAVIPGNAHISMAERQRRIEGYYAPYHSAVESLLDECIKADHPPAIVSLHSFTQEWHGCLRPWEAALLWDEDARLVRPMLDCLRKETDFNIGDNEPYTGRLQGDSMYRHGTSRGLAHVLVEIRQDQIRDAEGQKEWAGRLSDILTRIMADRELAHELAVIRK